jgi:hypothetical protein
MSAYKDAFLLTSTDCRARLTAAADLLAESKAVVVLDNTVAFRPDADKILCEVIASGSLAPEEQIEAAKCLLRASTLGSLISQEHTSGSWLTTTGPARWSCGGRANEPVDQAPHHDVLLRPPGFWKKRKIRAAAPTTNPGEHFLEKKEKNTPVRILQRPSKQSSRNHLVLHTYGYEQHEFLRLSPLTSP